jgi:integrase
VASWWHRCLVTPRIALTLHGLRHTFATLGLEAGVDTLYVSEILGHSSPAMTMSIYQHTREERLEQAIRQVGDANLRFVAMMHPIP